ncbi:hypothetical protein [Salinisphaera japonica]|uniref:hypothetical protein n=1 Tax=Salinisphaera japonica TaxID=1304270 RepID=UPI0011CEABA6|nr:hypothetical protein [Salinisphaera japonica]
MIFRCMARGDIRLVCAVNLFIQPATTLARPRSRPAMPAFTTGSGGVIMFFGIGLGKKGPQTAGRAGNQGAWVF